MFNFNFSSSDVTIALAFFAIGLTVGYCLRSWIFKVNKGIWHVSDSQIILYAVAGIWVISMIFDIFSPIYETSPLVHGLMGAIVGFFYKPLNKKNENE